MITVFLDFMHPTSLWFQEFSFVFSAIPNHVLELRWRNSLNWVQASSLGELPLELNSVTHWGYPRDVVLLAYPHAYRIYRRTLVDVHVGVLLPWAPHLTSPLFMSLALPVFLFHYTTRLHPSAFSFGYFRVFLPRQASRQFGTQWGTRKKNRAVPLKIVSAMADPKIEEILAPLRSAVKEQVPRHLMPMLLPSWTFRKIHGPMLSMYLPTTKPVFFSLLLNFLYLLFLLLLFSTYLIPGPNIAIFWQDYIFTNATKLNLSGRTSTRHHKFHASSSGEF